MKNYENKPESQKAHHESACMHGIQPDVFPSLHKVWYS